MPVLTATSDATPGGALAEFFSDYTELWDDQQLASGGLTTRDVFEAIGDLIDTRFTCSPEATRLTWEPIGQSTPDNNPVLSQDTLIGKLLCSIRRDNRALMLNVRKLALLGIHSLADGRYILTIDRNLIEINGRPLWRSA